MRHVETEIRPPGRIRRRLSLIAPLEKPPVALESTRQRQAYPALIVQAPPRLAAFDEPPGQATGLVQPDRRRPRLGGFRGQRKTFGPDARLNTSQGGLDPVRHQLQERMRRRHA